MIISHKRYDLFGKMIFEKAIIKPPFKKPNPMPNEACFLFVIEGEAVSISEIERLNFHAKESVLMKCGNYISRMLPSKSSKTYQAVAIHFHPDVLKKVYENDLPSFLKKSQNKEGIGQGMAKIKSSTLLIKYIDSLLFYFENPDLVNEELLILKLRESILLLNQTQDAPAIQQILSSLFSPTVYSIKQIINSHIFSDLAIEDIAQLCNLSLSSFKREFRKIYNDSPANYIKNRKLEQASELLLISDQRISDIAYDCGFNDLAHFSKSFLAKFKMSPSNYRLNQNDKSLG